MKEEKLAGLRRLYWNVQNGDGPLPLSKKIRGKNTIVYVYIYAVITSHSVLLRQEGPWSKSK